MGTVFHMGEAETDSPCRKAQSAQTTFARNCEQTSTFGQGDHRSPLWSGHLEIAFQADWWHLCVTPPNPMLSVRQNARQLCQITKHAKQRLHGTKNKAYQFLRPSTHGVYEYIFLMLKLINVIALLLFFKYSQFDACNMFRMSRGNKRLLKLWNAQKKKKKRSKHYTGEQVKWKEMHVTNGYKSCSKARM